MSAEDVIKYASPWGFAVWGLMVVLLIGAVVFLWKQNKAQSVGNETLARIEGALQVSNEKHNATEERQDKLENKVSELEKQFLKIEWTQENIKTNLNPH